MPLPQVPTPSQNPVINKGGGDTDFPDQEPRKPVRTTNENGDEEGNDLTTGNDPVGGEGEGTGGGGEVLWLLHQNYHPEPETGAVGRAILAIRDLAMTQMV